MIEQKQYFKQMVDFNKNAFDNSFNAIVSIQDQAETMSNKAMEQASWIPEEGRKAMNEWIKMCKKGRDDFKKSVDEIFMKAEAPEFQTA